MSKEGKKYFNEFVDKATNDFHPRDVMRFIEWKTRGMQIPHDGTITRYIRERRNLLHDVELVNSVTSLYRKVK